MGWIDLFTCFIGREKGDIGLGFSLSTKLKMEVVRTMARNGEEYQYDSFESHLHRIPHVQGSGKCILSRINKNYMTLPTFSLPYLQKIKYFGWILCIDQVRLQIFHKITWPIVILKAHL